MNVELTRREREVLCTTLSQEIYKMHLHYGEGNAPERLQTLYSLRDKLCVGKEAREDAHHH